jgi:hypothetical protein
MGKLVLGGVLSKSRDSSNLVLLVPTEGGLPLLDIGALRKNLGKPQERFTPPGSALVPE